MLSLDSITAREDVQAFDTRMRRELESDHVIYTAEPKFDGLSVELVYDQGTFVRGSTRGDGRIGEDVTVNLRTIRALPLQLRHDSSPPAHLVVRGEVYMRLDAFQVFEPPDDRARGRGLCQSPQCGGGIAAHVGQPGHRLSTLDAHLL